MIPRIERSGEPLKREVLRRRRRPFAPSPSEQNPELALVYSNGYVTVEISQEAFLSVLDDGDE